MNLFPLMSDTGLPPELQFLPALLIGIGFGFALERAGFGDARILAAQFYGHNMRVFKVMFTGIITAAAGLALTSALGLLSWEAIFIPETFVQPHLFGGLLLGAGFIISGYCPGTSVVAMASGKWDALVAIIGVAAGSVLYGEVYPWISEFHGSTALGVTTLPDVLGISYEVLVLLLVLGAAGAFFGAEKAETLIARLFRRERETGTWSRGAHAAIGALVLVSLVAMVVHLAAPHEAAPQGLPEPGRISALDLGRAMIEEPQRYIVADLRGRPACDEATSRIPGALCLEDLEESLEMYSEGRALVVFGAESVPAQALPPSLARFRGELLALEGGKTTWDALITGDPEQAEAYASLSPADRSAASALHAYFTGTRARPRPQAAPVKMQRKMKKSGGCG
ncbi:MAG: YeeE/YedE thiosulfate transporter family protein [Pseudomonadota bacterium]